MFKDKEVILEPLVINYKLFSLFFNNLINIDQTLVPDDLDPILVDTEIYPYQILTTKKTKDFLINFFDKTYFVNRKKPNIPYSEYYNFKKKLGEKVLKKGSLVKLLLDDEIYEVEALDLDKNRATIVKDSNKNTKVTLRVNLELLKLANLEKSNE